MNMIKRLRRKFIIMATIGVLVVLGGALGLINTIAYMRMNQQVMSVLTYIIHNNGAVPQKIGGDDGSFFSDPSWTEETPEFAYQIRFFSVLVNAGGYAEKIDIQHIASFSEKKPSNTPGRLSLRRGKTERNRAFSKRTGPVMPI